MPTERWCYVDAASGLHVQIDAAAWAVFDAHRQWRVWQRERGGVLFAPSAGSDGQLTLVEASAPHPRDKAGWAWLELDHQRCLTEIEERFRRGLHFVGYWHTHAEKHPVPSKRDVDVFRANLREGGIALEKLVAVIVGTAPDAAGVCVATVGRDGRPPTLLAPQVVPEARESRGDELR